mmetsp:Transcript_30642/g.98019  ORF Transcript_30642/g.98019 Transcript_30642/m.98019 type:complete len:140 (-) Transcript_30642:303-722(-)
MAVPVAATAAQYKVPDGEWAVGPWDCCSDPGAGALVCCCAPCALGQIKEMVTTGNASAGFIGDMETCCLYLLVEGCTGCGFLISMGVRTELRNKYKLPETPCGDCLFNCCCPCCAITQELKEVRTRVVNGGPDSVEMAR